MKHGEQIKREHYSTYAKDDIPAEWHYKNSSMVQQIVVVAEAGHAFRDFEQLSDMYREEAGGEEVDPLSAVYGLNGYEPSVRETHTVLFARGPEIRKHALNAMPGNATRGAVNTVDVHSLLCHVLDLGEGCDEGRDGDLRNLYSILENQPGNGFVSNTIHKVKKYFAAKEHIPVAGKCDRIKLPKASNVNATL